MQKHLQATLQPYFPKQNAMAATTGRLHLPEFHGSMPTDKPSNVFPKTNL